MINVNCLKNVVLAPAKELDVWYAEPASDFKSLRVYWKVSFQSGCDFSWWELFNHLNSEWLWWMIHVTLLYSFNSLRVCVPSRRSHSVWACSVVAIVTLSELPASLLHNAQTEGQLLTTFEVWHPHIHTCTSSPSTTYTHSTHIYTHLVSHKDCES